MTESHREAVGSFFPCWAPRTDSLLVMPLSVASPDGAEGAAPGPGVARVLFQFQFYYLQCLNLKQIFRY